jgi:hypothetical protein
VEDPRHPPENRTADPPGGGGDPATRIIGGPPAAVVVATALLLASYLGVIVWGLLSPSNDPQRGMAQGCLSLAALAVLALAGLLWFGAARGHRRLVWILFWMCAFPAFLLIAQGVFLLIRQLRGH